MTHFQPFALGRLQATHYKRVRFVDHALDFTARDTAIQNNCIPVTLVHVVTGQNCSNWTSASDSIQGTEAYINAADDRWTDSFYRDCNSSWYHLYCFSEVPTYIFMDEFESGNTAGWPAIIPGP